MKKLLPMALGAGLLLLAPVLLPAGEEGAGGQEEEYRASLGFYGSPDGAGGLAWHYWFDGFGLGMSAMAVYTPGDVDYWWYSAMVDGECILGAWELAEWLQSDLYALVHVGFAASNADPWYSDPVAGAWVPDTFVTAGFGFEVTLFRHFSLPLEVGMSVHWPLQAGPSFSGGLRYRF